MIDIKSIVKSRQVGPPRVMVYGPHGLGKTTFGAGAPKPVFILTEDGLGKLQVPHFPLAQTQQGVIDAIGALYEGEHDYQTVVLDSLDWLETMIWADINSRYDAKELAYGKGAVFAVENWRVILDGLTALRNERGMTIVLIGHAAIKRFDSPETEPYERYQPKLQDRSSALIQEWCDCVLFCNYKTIIQKSDVGFNNTVKRGVSTGERLLHTVEKPAHHAKNRFALPETLPLSWPAFQAAVDASIAPKPATTKVA